MQLADQAAQLSDQDLIRVSNNQKFAPQDTTGAVYITWGSADEAYLPGVEVNRDHEGGSSRVRPLHCTSDGLTPTITPNVGNSNAQFLIVGDCVRALPYEF